MNSFPSRKIQEEDQEIINLLKDLGSLKSEYPEELFAARRATFVTQIEHLSPVDVGEELSSTDREIIKLLGSLETVRAEYPPKLLAARRSAFLRQMAIGGRISLLEKLRASVQSIFRYKREISRLPTTDLLR